MGDGGSASLIEAVIVNHNTSPFAELCLRSLMATGGARGRALRVTVADNHSTDDGVVALRDAAAELGAAFELTRWPVSTATTITHGDVLRDFVLSRREAPYFLFLDADIVFLHDNTVGTMLRELESSAKSWAVQARYVSPERRLAGSTLDMGAGDPQVIDAGFPGTTWRWTVRGTGKRRLHPGCALVANSEALLHTADMLGFGTFAGLSQDESIAGYYDTLAVASAVMATHGLGYELSSRLVVHYFNVSYDDRTDLTRSKRQDVQRRLEILRDDPQASPAAGPWG